MITVISFWRTAAIVLCDMSSTLQGGVYRIVKEALGGFWAKAAVSALLFDYVLTGPMGCGAVKSKPSEGQ
jgi:hypothetical protein